jgi:hypothetical protein
VSQSECMLIDCAERDGTYITLSCVLFSTVVESESGGYYFLLQNLTVYSNLHYYIKKQVQLLSLLSMNKCIVFLQFLNKGFTVIFFNLFSSALPISLNFPFICVLSFVVF